MKTCYNKDKLIKMILVDEQQEVAVEEYYTTFKHKKKYKISHSYFYTCVADTALECLDTAFNNLFNDGTHFIKENAIFEKPKIIFYFDDDFEKTIYFDTYEQALESYKSFKTTYDLKNFDK